jgi:hypothetical protein
MDAGTAFTDLSVQVTRRRTRCVLDPNLALSRDGAALARLTAPYAENWVVPELFSILDSAQLYEREPELLIWPGTDQGDLAAVPEMLRDWMQLREEAGRCLYWVGDALRESFLPDDLDESVLARWEAASRTLEGRLPQTIEATGPLIAAMRDAAALCVVLPNACILGRGKSGEVPPICRHLRQWGLECEKLTAQDYLARIERAAFLRLIVAAGLAPLVWNGLHLVVAHLCVPHIGRLRPMSGTTVEVSELPDEPHSVICGSPWDEAKCFWYEVSERLTHNDIG